MTDSAPVIKRAVAGVGPDKYDSLARENERRYGTEWARIGPTLLANRYDDRTHCIYELLQNAEDALRKRPGWAGSKSVRFDLSDDYLRVSHFGKPFDEGDVRGICGIHESTKDLTAIGRFGIGFKSVMSFTDRPQVHSGVEDFAIENFIKPVGVEKIERDTDETIIVIPLRSRDDVPVIVHGLASLGPTSLLFLREVDQIEWSVQGGPSGHYHRSQQALSGDLVRQVNVIGQQSGQTDVDEDWLVFSHAMLNDEGKHVGFVEIAFNLEKETAETRRRMRPIARSPLSVYFPTVVETHLGFLLQGPLRTTPSRDNVPKSDPWNIRCIGKAAELLVEALHWLGKNELLDAAALSCLPIDPTKFEDGSMFAPIYDKVKAALSSDRLLPRYGGAYLSAQQSFLARTQELRKLIGDDQLAELFAESAESGWLSDQITQDRTPELRQYLIRELRVTEITPESFIGRLNAAFLKRQPDAWIERLYVFLNTQPALKTRIAAVPIVRLTDGSHVRAFVDGHAQAFLAGSFETGFPTVRADVCRQAEAQSFLASLGLTIPDRVDDVIRNVLPLYQKARADVTSTDYAGHIERMLAAYKSDSKGKRDQLVAEAQKTAFVMSISAADKPAVWTKPGDTYIATERLKELLSGVTDAYIVDEGHKCLRGQDARDFLEACGATRHLRLVAAPDIGWDARAVLRKKAGHAETSGQNDRVTDLTLFGLEAILQKLETLDPEARRHQAKLLWEELDLIEERRGKGVFVSEYSWTHYGSYRTNFEATFVRTLNETPWVPGAEAELCVPGLVPFEELGWRENPFLLAQIRFKPPIIEQLAKEAGFEPGVLDLLKKLDVTSEAALRARLRIPEASRAPTEPPAGQTSPAADLNSEREANEQDTPGGGNDAGGRDNQTQPQASTGKPLPMSGPRAPATAGQSFQPQSPQAGSSPEATGEDAGSDREKDTVPRPFISFLGVHHDGAREEPDGLSHEARMMLEERAITFILLQEPSWQRTPAGNPGFDLFKADDSGTPVEWCEVKAMTSSLDDHPVGISPTQFSCAEIKGEKAWLYIVERAGTETPSIVRIQDPVGKIRTFTFDRGWRSVDAGSADSA